MVDSLRNLHSALDRLMKNIDNLTDAFKMFSEVAKAARAARAEIADEKSNNWRKLHGLPMRRRKCNQ